MFRAVQYYTHYPALRTKYYRQLLFEHIIAMPKQWVIFGTVLEPLPDTPTDLSTAALTLKLVTRLLISNITSYQKQLSCQSFSSDTAKICCKPGGSTAQLMTLTDTDLPLKNS